MDEFTVTSSQLFPSGSALTKLTGEMDGSNFDLLEDEFNKLLESGIDGLILDISGVDGLTSAGIGAILNMSSLLASRKGKLVVAAPRPKILGTIEMLGIQDTLTIAPNFEAAKKILDAR